MEWVGWFALIIVLCYSSYPGKVKKLERQVKRLKRRQEGDNNMSKMINELIGKKCIIKTTDDAISLVGSDAIDCTVLDADDEWVKITYTDKKNNIRTKILRIEVIDNVELINE